MSATQMTRNTPKSQQEKTWKFLNNTVSDFSIEGKLIKKKNANANRVRFIFEDNFWHYACGNNNTTATTPSSPSSLSTSSSSVSSYSPPSSPSQNTFVDETLTTALPKTCPSEFVFTYTPASRVQAAPSAPTPRRPLLPPLFLLPEVSTSVSLPPICAGAPVWKESPAVPSSSSSSKLALSFLCS